MCDGVCKRSFHTKCVGVEQPPAKDWLCDDCNFGNMLCLICGEAGVVNEDVHKCKKPQCGRFYHQGCLQGDERVKWFKSQQDKFYCAQHVCAGCGEKPGIKPDKENFYLTCLKCPTASHLLCALGKQVKVLTHRSMFCEVS